MDTESHHLDRRVLELAEKQHQLITWEQLRELGASTRWVAARLRRGWLQRVHRGVYRVGTLRTWRSHWLAAVLACGEGAALSHRSAAALWEIRKSDSRVSDVTVPARGRRRRRGIAVHPVARLPSTDVTTRERIPVTTPARTLLDLASVLTPRALERAIDEAAHGDLCSEDDLLAIAEAHPTRSGTRALNKVLRSHRIGSTVTRSELEELFLRLCDRHLLPRPEVNVPVGPFVADFLWRDRSLIVETDGHRSHGTRAAFERDRARDARLVGRGYRVIRLTYRQVVSGDVGVLKALLDEQPLK